MEQPLSKDEESILLYLETCLVDNNGRMEEKRMKEVDFRIMETWKMAGLIDYSRLPFKEIEKLRKMTSSREYTHWVLFTDKAWELAHQHRKIKSERMIAKLKAL